MTEEYQKGYEQGVKDLAERLERFYQSTRRNTYTATVAYHIEQIKKTYLRRIKKMCEDCAFSRENGCVALTVKQCALDKSCSFYKTAPELKAGRAKAEARIAQLSEAEKVHIQHKYYGYKPKPVML